MYETKIILDSLAPSGGRLTTFEITLPRIVLAEFNTHRMFSRNSASSRAIPVEKMLKRVEEDPFIPQYWGANQKGMAADQEVTADEAEKVKDKWLAARNYAVKYATMLKELGIHKQLTNRLIEPWLWHTIICTATEYDNYFALRDNKSAAPEIKESAHTAHELYKASSPVERKSGQDHLPYVDGYDMLTLIEEDFTAKDLRNVSVGRCAAVSYLNHDKIRDPNGDVDRAVNRLLPGGHMSPFEHVARALDLDEWREDGVEMARKWIEDRVPMGNLWGWRQYRKTIANEHNFKLISSNV